MNADTDEGETGPKPPPARTDEETLWAWLNTAECALRRVREAVSVDAPAETQAELDRVNQALRDNGFEYPLGARGVRAMATQREAFLDDKRTVEAAVERVREVHRPADYRGTSICVECSAYDESYTTTDNAPVAHPCRTTRALDSDTPSKEQS